MAFMLTIIVAAGFIWVTRFEILNDTLLIPRSYKARALRLYYAVPRQ